MEERKLSDREGLPVYTLYSESCASMSDLKLACFEFVVNILCSHDVCSL